MFLSGRYCHEDYYCEIITELLKIEQKMFLTKIINMNSMNVKINGIGDIPTK